jgi:hypothetical protein
MMTRNSASAARELSFLRRLSSVFDAPRLRSRALAGLLLGFAVLSSCSKPQPQYSPTTTPEQVRRKVGIYIWGQVPDLAPAVEDARRIGSDYAVRAFIGPWSDTPPYQDDLRPLAEKLADEGYQTLFREFQVIMLTAYDSYSYAREYADRSMTGSGQDSLSEPPDNAAKIPNPSLGVAQALARLPPGEARLYLDHVRREFEEFAFALSQVDRTLIISNWEVENDVPEPELWPQMVAYLQARLDGIREGRERARQRNYPAKVFTAFEFTILPSFQGRPSGLVEIGGKLQGLDYLSYSSWWSIGSDYNPGEMRSSFQAAFQDMRAYARSAQLPERMIIGEFGEYWDFHPTAERLRAIVDASIESGAEYLFNWVLYDQPGELDDHGRDASHFGKYRQNRSLTPQGEALRDWFQPPG